MMQPSRSLHASLDLDAVDLAHLAAALRGASASVPDDRVDWEAFHHRLAVRAELPLARLRHSPVVTVATHQRARTLPMRRPPMPVARRWWEDATRWSRLTLSSALAAGIALVGVIRLTPKDGGAGNDGRVVSTSEDADESRASVRGATRS